MTFSEENYLKTIYHLNDYFGFRNKHQCYCRKNGNQSIISDGYAQEISRKRFS